jgi:hypothetical protein
MSSTRDSSGEKDVIEGGWSPATDAGGQISGKEGLRLEGTTSALSRIGSRLSTRDIVDPGPPPDGGLKAWLQVVMGFLVCFATW